MAKKPRPPASIGAKLPTIGEQFGKLDDRIQKIYIAQKANFLELFQRYEDLLRSGACVAWENCSAMNIKQYPQLTFRLPSALVRDLALVARIRSRSKSECLREALKIYCKLYINRPVVEESTFQVSLTTELRTDGLMPRSL